MAAYPSLAKMEGKTEVGAAERTPPPEQDHLVGFLATLFLIVVVVMILVVSIASKRRKTLRPRRNLPAIKKTSIVDQLFGDDRDNPW